MNGITLTMMCAAGLLCTSCWQQYQMEEEMAEYSVTPANWKNSDKMPCTNLWNVDVIDIPVTPGYSALLNSMPLWMYMYNPGYEGWRRVLTDTAHVEADGRSTCVPVKQGDFKVERIQQYRITSREDGHLLYSFNAALVGFNCPQGMGFRHDTSNRVYGELLWNLEGPETDKFEEKDSFLSLRNYVCTPETARKLDAAGS